MISESIYTKTMNKTGSVRIMLYGGAFVYPFLQWKSSKNYIFLVCVCSLWYPACNAHASYCHLWSVRFYNIFAHYHIKKARIFEIKLWKIEKALRFSLQCVSETFLILERTEGDTIKSV